MRKHDFFNIQNSYLTYVNKDIHIIFNEHFNSRLHHLLGEFHEACLVSLINHLKIRRKKIRNYIWQFLFCLHFIIFMTIRHISLLKYIWTIFFFPTIVILVGFSLLQI